METSKKAKYIATFSKRARKLFFVLLPIIGAVFAGSVTAYAADYTPHLQAGTHRKVCSVGSATTAGCFAKVVVTAANTPQTSALPDGYGPAQFHGAYQLPTTSSHPATVAIVGAYDAPNIISDVATYDKTFGLPVFATCTKSTQVACITKVGQSGSATLPKADPGWALELSMDVETVHQTCQNCKVVLVEASSASYTNLMKAVDEAETLGADVISNSYGSSESTSDTKDDSHFKHPGTAFVFSSGDSGYGPTYPAGSPYVTAVGGTSLSVSSANTWRGESIWSGSGSGCSAYEPKPVFQTDNGCKHRAIADIGADADPNTGAAVYDSYTYDGSKGWFQLGGTSLAAPLVAGAYGLANNVAATTYANSLPYKNGRYGSTLHDITSGSNGSCSTPLYLCNGTAGYDGPSGLGSLIGIGSL